MSSPDQSHLLIGERRKGGIPARESHHRHTEHGPSQKIFHSGCLVDNSKLRTIPFFKGSLVEPRRFRRKGAQKLTDHIWTSSILLNAPPTPQCRTSFAHSLDTFFTAADALRIRMAVIIFTTLVPFVPGDTMQKTAVSSTLDTSHLRRLFRHILKQLARGTGWRGAPDPAGIRFKGFSSSDSVEQCHIFTGESESELPFGERDITLRTGACRPVNRALGLIVIKDDDGTGLQRDKSVFCDAR